MIRLAGFGSYHTEGRAITVAGESLRTIRFTASTSYDYDPNGRFWIEQAYVQWFEPAAPRFPLPLVLLHGGGMSGAMWETTPDGRPGWLHRFLEAGFPVHVVDNVERGRAGFAAQPGVWPDPPIIRSQEEAWTLFRFGRAEDFAARRPFPGLRFPVAQLDAFSRQFVPRWTSTGPAHIRALGDVVARTGPCIVLCHSQGGEAALTVAAGRPDLVRAVVALEPSGFPTGDSSPGAGPLPLLIVLGDNLDATPTWTGLEQRILAFGRARRDAGGEVRVLSLPEQGIRGNSHMLMMDDNSDAIAGRVVDWLLKLGH